MFYKKMQEKLHAKKNCQQGNTANTAIAALNSRLECKTFVSKTFVYRALC
jgi:hypothetical protein